MCACPKERKRLSRGIQNFRWRTGTRNTVNMLSREISNPHLNADGHTSTNLHMFAHTIHKAVRLSVQSLYVEIHDVILVSMWHIPSYLRCPVLCKTMTALSNG